MATLIARISEDMMRQYDVVNNSVDYENGEPKLFGKLSPNGNCIFICPTFVLIGDYFSEIPNHSIQFQNVRRLALTNNDLLNLSAYNPEENSRTKASFYGYIQNNQIDINDLEQQYNLSQFISFNIIKEESLAQSINSLNENDRVVTLDSNNRLLELNVLANGSLNELNLGTGYFNAYGNSLDELITLMLSLQKPKTRHVTNINRIKNTLATNNLFRFPSFSDYYNIIHNKSLYANNPHITLGNVNVNNENTFSFKKNMALNTILFGPPGTGKTFNSINEALKIVSKNYFEEHKNDREKLTNKFKELLINNWEETKGQIAFCTFHQSFSYEDFVEGIKPKTTNDKNVYYDIEPGVFKRICQLAESNNSTVKVIKEGKFAWNEEQFNKATFYKLSLGAIYNPQDKPIYEYCRDNNYIAIGFGEENDFSGMNESQIVEKCKELELETTSSQQLNYFIHNIKKNNYVIIGNGNKYVRAIGKVIGDYEYVADSPIQYNHFRKVEWLFVDANIPIEELYGKGLSQKTLYKIDETALKKDFFTNKGQKEVIEDKEDKKYVLIIDEINRGNVSSIFGELITLIEKDKRAGSTEELEITLPYSKEPFKVPSNVYIIGTMNTADRSVEALDTALRRRFSFKEIMPDDKVITEKNFKDYDRASIMNLINQRIEVLLDRNYTLGHSYFIKEDFKNSFENEIIPLLQEYFYNDYGKIGLVLGKGFVREKEITKNNNKNIFADFDTKNEVDIVKSYELIPFNDINFKEALDILLL